MRAAKLEFTTGPCAAQVVGMAILRSGLSLGPAMAEPTPKADWNPTSETANVAASASALADFRGPLPGSVLSPSSNLELVFIVFPPKKDDTLANNDVSQATTELIAAKEVFVANATNRRLDRTKLTETSGISVPARILVMGR